MILRRKKLSRELRPGLYQALAVFFVVLYLLSAFRGLVPGLCLNLRPADTASADARIQSASASCCTVRDTAEEGAPEPAPAAPKRCPMCRLALGLTEVPTYVHFEPLSGLRFAPPFPAPDVVIPQWTERHLFVRGPPALFHA